MNPGQDETRVCGYVYIYTYYIYIYIYVLYIYTYYIYIRIIHIYVLYIESDTNEAFNILKGPLDCNSNHLLI